MDIKELISKFATLIASLEEKDIEKTISQAEEIQKTLTDFEKQEEETAGADADEWNDAQWEEGQESPEGEEEETKEIAKFTNEEKVKILEAIEKYASLNVSSDNLKELFEDLASVKQRLEVVEKARGASKQNPAEVEKTDNGLWGNLPI